MPKCSAQNCNKIATYNIKGIKPSVCLEHKSPNMINTSNKLCEESNCTVRASFGYKGIPPKFCVKHKIVDMIYLNKRKTCDIELCSSEPIYNIKGLSPKFCRKHKTDEMIRISATHCCKYDGCNTIPVFNYKGSEKGSYCSKHKLSEMIDIVHKRCENYECKLQPSYDFKGHSGRFCTSHKLPGMVDIKNVFCKYIGCEVVNPVFNIKGSKKGHFCIVHKSHDMIDVKHMICNIDGCNIRPTYNIKGCKKGIYCFEHKKSDMIDVSHPLCIYDGCKVRPSYDFKGGKGKCCKMHKEIGMVDIANKQCDYKECIIRPTYGKPGHHVIRCSIHKEPGMIRKSNARCKSNNCKEMAVWGINQIPSHCEIHKLEDENNLIESLCISCGLSYILDDEKKCENCHPQSFERISLSKQRALMAYLDSNGLIGNSTDREIDSGACGKERPDRVYDFGDKIIILECDENQHKDRSCECEQVRMVNIGQSFGGIPVYFIRFNPDEYITKNNSTVIESLLKRYKLCEAIIKDIYNNKIKLPYAFVSVIYLFYDGWTGISNENWKIITSMHIS